jgi:predicted GNAT family acetyltransferase
VDITVADVPPRHRYEARAGGRLAGHLQYRLEGRVMTLVHTEVESAYEGKGVGGGLIRGTLDDIRARNLSVVPVCPFARSWIERHPDYADLVRR